MGLWRSDLKNEKNAAPGKLVGDTWAARDHRPITFPSIRMEGFSEAKAMAEENTLASCLGEWIFMQTPSI
jgi:hypothetical protein